MASQEEIKGVRLEKLAKLKEKGVNPYPISCHKDFDNKDVIAKFEDISTQDKPITLVGRIMALRPQGGLAFFNFDDGTAKFQGLLKKEFVAEGVLESFLELVDVGDFIQVTGKLFVTKKGEKTLQVSGWKIISKSLRPLPEKWHGLQDVEERFRKRYLDLLMSAEVRTRFISRSSIISCMRLFLAERGFMEVETPILQSLAGGASATPFETHHNALDLDFSLRIAPELYLKKLLIAGYPKIFEIGRNFRNEGIDTTHNPEFTMLEYYEAYSTAEKQMKFVEKLLRKVVSSVHDGKQIFSYGDQEIDISKEFEKISFFDLLKKYSGIENPESINRSEAEAVAKKNNVAVIPGDSLPKILDNIYKKTARHHVVQPTFVVDYPAEFIPLAKRREDDAKIVDVFQILIGGMEIVKGFSELNDPIDQKERFKTEEKNKKAGDHDAQSMDDEFIEAMEYGMPPAGGVGIGIDRLTMLLTDQKNIKEVILFPTLKPERGS
jgi:lysyl-tRNA synthetase class 2